MPLDDAFSKIGVTYFRYQDDVLIFCQTRRQLTRCKRRLMEVLHERRLSLSRKKTRMGSIEKGFHFLGIHYLGTQPSNYTDVTQANERSIIRVNTAHIPASLWGGSRYCN